MCGVAGIARIRDCDVPDRDQLERMVGAIRHRGPDDEGYYQSPGIGFGHARLSVIDVDGGHQPIHNQDKSIWITYNGEIFNYLELRQDLERRGHNFYTESDTEVVVHMYEEFGLDFVQQLNGQFAIALWDTRTRELHLVRDRVGILPLFYAITGDQLVFASEIKALLASDHVSPILDPVGLDQVFTFWCPIAPRTMFAGVNQVCPGEIVTLSKGSISTRMYWTWDFPDVGSHTSNNDAALAEELNDILADATRIRLRADVPVGAYLSGGLDSSSLVALIKEQNISKLRTFSIGFDEAGFDEAEHQLAMSRYLDTEHSSIQCSKDDIAKRFIQSIWFCEAPILRTAPTPMSMLSELVREKKFKVVITGEGADEVFGGYDVFKEAKVREFWSRNPASAWRPALLKRLYPYLDFSGAQSQAYLKAFFGAGIDDAENPLFAHLPRWKVASQIKMFYSETFKSTVASDVIEDFRNQVPVAAKKWHRFNRWELIEAQTILPGYILSSQGDRMLMANSIEGRFPFLDHRLIEFARMLPPKLKMRAMNEKFLLKKAMAGRLPASIVNRTKQPYRAPNASAFAAGRAFEVAEELLSRENVAQAGYFDADKVTRLVQKLRRGNLVGERDNMAFIGVLSTQIWHNTFVNNSNSVSM